MTELRSYPSLQAVRPKGLALGQESHKDTVFVSRLHDSGAVFLQDQCLWERNLSSDPNVWLREVNPGTENGIRLALGAPLWPLVRFM